MYPNGEEFLPRAPDPEDIIYDTDEGNTKDSSIVDINTRQEPSLTSNTEEQPATTNTEEQT